MEVGVLLVDEGDQLAFADASACRLLGFENGAQLHAHWRDVCPEPLGVSDDHGERLTTLVARGGAGVRARVYSLPERGQSLLVICDEAEADIDRLHATQLRSLSALRRSLEHHFRGALNALAINVELLRGEISGNNAGSEGSAERCARYLAMLAKEVARLPDSLSAVLSRLEPIGAGTDRFDLRQMVEEVREVIAAQARIHRVTLRSTLPDTEVGIEANRAYLKQGLLNLCVNALTAMPSGGALDIDVEVCEGYAVVKVRDEGPGLPRECVDDSGRLLPSMPRPGSGLDVAATAVARAGGWMRVESVSGSGTTVCLQLPSARG